MTTHVTRKTGVAVLGLGLLALAGCEEREPVLAGDRIPVYEALETRRPVETPMPDQRAFVAPRETVNSSWSQSPASPAYRTENPSWDGVFDKVWSRSIGEGDSKRSRLITDPVVGAGLVYTMDSAATISAVSTEDGSLVWDRAIVPSQDEPEAAFGGGLALADGVLYATSGFGRLVALDAQSGRRLWRQKLDSAATSAPTVVDDLVYLVSSDQTAWAIETSSGRVRWQIEGAGDLNNRVGGGAPAVAGDKVVFAFGAESLQTLFREGGFRVWSSDVLGRGTGIALAYVDDLSGPPVVADGRVYAGNSTGHTVALDLFSGDPLWSLPEGADGPVWPAGDSIFFVTDENALMRVDARDGSPIWSTPLPGYDATRTPSRTRETLQVQYGPVLAGGALVVAGGDGQLRRFDPEDGSLLSQTDLPSGATTRPVVAGGQLYVVTSDGVLHSLR